MKNYLFAALMVAAVPCLATATTIVSENFESYADTAELGGVWTLGDGTLDTTNGNPGNSLNHPGTGANFSAANTNTISFPAVYPGPGQKLILEGDIFDDGSNENRRNTIGLRTAAGANIIEMGMYNGPTHYAIRTVLFGEGSDGSWVSLPGAPTFEGEPVAVEGWHTFRAEITDSDVVFTLDIDGDGSIEATHTATIFQNDTNAFDIIRLGGPSNLGSTFGGAKFDNISLSLVPEPVSALLALLAMAPMIGRRRTL